MARPRMPTEVLELKGAFQRNPQRRRPVGAKAKGDIGQTPAYFSPAEVLVWQELIDNAPGGVLTSADRPLVEVVARLLAKFRSDWLNGTELSTLLQCLVRLGWTPSDRSKITAQDSEDEASPFQEFLQ